MRLARKPTYLLLLFLLTLNLIARYPRTPHELGFDGFVLHGMTESLIQNGFASWILHPFSYLGLYPLSQPSGSIFFLAGFAQLSGTPRGDGHLFAHSAAVPRTRHNQVVVRDASERAAGA